MINAEIFETEAQTISLCSPTADLTCFGCCPPIRPHHYDCLDYVGSLRREFSENRKFFLKHGPIHRPIVGFHCWALGFLDSKGRRVGCLLHPSHNGGRDLRSLIDYGNKCGRESCVAAGMFDLLPLEGRRFWLPLAQGLSPFHYSSPRANPLFHLLLWGPRVLEPLRLLAERNAWNETELLYHHPFLMDNVWNPKAHRYLLQAIIEMMQHPYNGVESGRHESFKESHRLVDTYARELHRRILSSSHARAPSEGLPGCGFTHNLPLEPDFLDFLRLGLGWRRATLEQALEIKEELNRLARSFGPHLNSR